MASGGTNLGIRIEVDVGGGIAEVERLTQRIRELTEASSRVSGVASSFAAVNTILEQTNRVMPTFAETTLGAARASASIMSLQEVSSMLSSAFAELARAEDEAAQGASSFAEQAARAFSAAEGLVTAVRGFAASSIARRFANAARSAIQYADSLQAVRNRLGVILQSQSLANREFEEFRNVLIANGFSVEANVEAMANFANAAISAGAGLDGVNEELRQLTQVGRNLNLNNTQFRDLVTLLDTLRAGGNLDLIRTRSLQNLGLSLGQLAEQLGFSSEEEFNIARSRGQISGRAAVDAILRNAESQANPDRIVTVNEAFQSLSDTLGGVIDALGDELRPSLVSFAQSLTGLIQRLPASLGGGTAEERAEAQRQREFANARELALQRAGGVQGFAALGLTRSRAPRPRVNLLTTLLGTAGFAFSIDPNDTQELTEAGELELNTRAAEILARNRPRGMGMMTQSNPPTELGVQLSTTIRNLSSIIETDFSRALAGSISSLIGLSDEAFNARDALRSFARDVLQEVTRSFTSAVVSEAGDFLSDTFNVVLSRTRNLTQEQQGGFRRNSAV